MAEKLKRRVRAKTEVRTNGQLAAAIEGSASQIWLAGLGAYSKAQVEGTRLFNSLIEEGKRIQDCATKAAYQAQADGVKFFEDLVKEGGKVQQRAARAASHSITDARATASGIWDRLENVFEDRVAQALHSLNVPTKREIEALGKRVSELTDVTKKLVASGRTTRQRARRG
jgi:poly(hydroxyalkanoate) granule-associated protein